MLKTIRFWRLTRHNKCMFIYVQCAVINIDLCGSHSLSLRFFLSLLSIWCWPSFAANKFTFIGISCVHLRLAFARASNLLHKNICVISLVRSIVDLSRLNLVNDLPIVESNESFNRLRSTISETCCSIEQQMKKTSKSKSSIRLQGTSAHTRTHTTK